MTSSVRVLLPDKPVESLDAYLAGGGGEALKKALAMPGQEIIAEVKVSGLRGRGGAGFPTGMKWASVAQDSCPTKYFVCNGAEGEPGTFKDRELLLRMPHLVLEGVILAALVTGATEGFIFIRHEYPEQIEACRKEIARAEELGVCGPNALLLGRPFSVSVFVSPGGYICGEQSALIEAMSEDRKSVV